MRIPMFSGRATFDPKVAEYLEPHNRELIENVIGHAPDALHAHFKEDEVDLSMTVREWRDGQLVEVVRTDKILRPSMWEFLGKAAFTAKERAKDGLLRY